MARRKLTPRQRDVVWMLREAHEEDLSTVLNQLRPEPTAHGLSDVRVALEGLRAMGLVDIGVLTGTPRSFAPVDRTVVAEALSEGGPFEWQAGEESWLWHGSLIGLDNDLTVIVTDAGEAALEQ